MSKLAIFVEGLTERLFAEKLVRTIGGRNHARIEVRRTTGKVSDRRRFRLLSVDPDTGQRHYVLIVDCSNDELVNSRIREEYESLVRGGYGLIIGLRDVYPNPRHDIPRIRRRQLFGLRTSPISVIPVLAIMEIEAWFLAEYTHFLRLNPAVGVNPTMIRGWFCFDPSTEDMSVRDMPALDMSKVYFLAGKEYRKEYAILKRTVDLLDFDDVCLKIAPNYPDLNLLVTAITDFLFPQSDGY